MIKREHILWILTGCSLFIGATGAVTGINANARLTRAISEPTSVQWEALRKELKSNYYYDRTFFENEGEKTDDNGKKYYYWDGSYSVFVKRTENTYELRGIYIYGFQYDGEKAVWRC